MGLPELKNKVLLYIENADENQLAKVSDFIEFYKKDDLLLKEAIEKAKLQVLNGETISHEKVIAESKKRYPKYFKNEN
jgi:hypothetical protein